MAQFSRCLRQNCTWRECCGRRSSVGRAATGSPKASFGLGVAEAVFDLFSGTAKPSLACQRCSSRDIIGHIARGLSSLLWGLAAVVVQQLRWRWTPGQNTPAGPAIPNPVSPHLPISPSPSTLECSADQPVAAFLISFRAGTQSPGEICLIQGFNAGSVDPKNSRSVTFLPAEPSYY